MGSHTITRRHGRNDATPAAAVLPAPRLVQWMATSRCPLACPHCLADALPTTSHQPMDAAPRTAVVSLRSRRRTACARTSSALP